MEKSKGAMQWVHVLSGRCCLLCLQCLGHFSDTHTLVVTSVFTLFTLCGFAIWVGVTVSHQSGPKQALGGFWHCEARLQASQLVTKLVT